MTHLPLSVRRLTSALFSAEAASAAVSGAPNLSPLQAIVEAGLCSEDQLATSLALIARRPRARLENEQVDRELLERVGAERVRRLLALPLCHVDGRVRVAFCDPLDFKASQEVGVLIGAPIEVVVTTASEIEAALVTLETAVPERDPDVVEACLKSIDPREVRAELAQRRVGSDSAPTIRLVDELLREASRINASDIHMETSSDELVVRARLNGVLHEVRRLPGFLRFPIVSRIKVMASMDVAEHRIPQDGQFSFEDAGRSFTGRVSTMPSIHGENVTIRLLDQNAGHLDLEQMGLDPAVRRRLERAVRAPQGIILSTGPTGSGKTSTQYALLKTPVEDGRKTVTLENPVEYRLEGATQIEINERAGMTFASGLRATLRQDPNVILVGEIRDLDTAEIAFRAALTGHLVLTTLHTNDAVGTIVRLLDLGVEPQTVAAALSTIVAQRLVRRLCPCAETYQPSPDELSEMGLPEQATYRRPTGCDDCAQTGYAGRMGIYEIVEMTPPLRATIAEGASEEEIRRGLIRAGVSTLHSEARRLVRRGVTGIAEIRRILPQAMLARSICPNCAAEVYADFTNCPQCLSRLTTQSETGSFKVMSDSVVVADDDEGIREVVAQYVESLGLKVHRASDGPEAIRLARELLPAAVVLDVFMPRLTGIQACKRLRSDARTASIPVILMTADEGQELKLAAYDMGTDDFVRKPVDRKEFVTRLERLLSRKARIDAQATRPRVLS